MTTHDEQPSGKSARRYPDRESPLADVAAETRAEMDFHIQTRADLYVRDGMTPEEALARARAEFGDRARAHARCVAIGRQQERRRRLLDSVGALPQDTRYALRRLAASPGFTVVAVLTLALGIGANSAIFSVVNGVLLRPLPFADADRLAMIWNDNRRLGMRTDITSWPTFEDWRAESRSFASMAGFTHRGVNLGGDFEPERLAAAAVSVELFDVLGVRPASGRTFTREEMAPGAAPVAILSHSVAAQRFGSAGGAAGRMVRLNGTETEVVGVMPAGFNFPADTAVWTPLQISDGLRQARGAFFLYVVGRLADGVTLEQAQAEMHRVAAALEEAYPTGAGLGIFVQPIRTHLVGDVRPAILVLLGAVGLVLLIACANVASLLLARAAARQREMAVRVALGAGRGQLIRQLLTESVTIALAGGSLGLVLAYGGVRLLRMTAPADLPRLDEITVDPTVLGFTLALSVLTGMLFGFVPALHASRKDLTRALNDENRSSVGAPSGWRTRGALMVAELATSLILLIGTALLVQSFLRVSRLDSGFDGRGVLTARVVLTGSSYEEPNAVIGFYDRLFARLRALPNVQRVAAGTDVLLEALPNSAGISVEGKPREPAERRIEVTMDAVTPGYFQAIGTPLLLGRDVGPQDRANGVPVALVNQAMVRRYWPDEDPLGKRFKFGRPDNENPWITVVGVVGDARRTAPEREARPSAYLPHRQRPRAGMMLVIRSSGRPLRLAGAVRGAVQELDPHQPVSELATLKSLLGERIAQRRLTTLVAGIFSVVAILLALVGVYGVLSYAVAQSTREIGVRMALGAQVADVMGMVFGKATWLLAAGLALGLLGALLMTRGLASLLYGIDPLDPLTFAVAPVLLAAAALLACYLPARRATRVDPVVALRAEG